MKPRIVKTKGAWYCSSRFYGVVGHSHLAWGFGATPAEAYDQWSRHWGVQTAVAQ